jgi:hypothetical protein
MEASERIVMKFKDGWMDECREKLGDGEAIVKIL